MKTPGEVNRDEIENEREEEKGVNRKRSTKKLNGRKVGLRQGQGHLLAA